ncbi:MAG: ribonuclease protein component [Candidatus Hydrogenedentes bacterium]|nr:ribonuclease protein component [Candidatus Hydrogenedentota bacterium]
MYREGRKWVGREFVFYVARGDGQGRKIGYVVSRKVGGAVVRNRIKRYIREIYRTHRSDLAPDAHIVLVARPSSAALDYRQCEHSIRRLFRQGDDPGE